MQRFMFRKMINQRKNIPPPTPKASLYSVFYPLIPWYTSKANKYPDG